MDNDKFNFKNNLKKELIIVILIASVILVGGNLFGQSLAHPLPEKMYANDGGRQLLTIDLTTGSATSKVSESPVPQGRGYIAKTFEPSGSERLFAGQGSGSSDIYIINTVTGLATKLGNTGLGATAVNGMDTAPDCSVVALLNQVTGDANNHLVTINKATGLATDRGSVGRTGMDSIAFSSDGTLYGVVNTVVNNVMQSRLYLIALNPAGLVASVTEVGGSGQGLIKVSGTNKSPSGGILAIEIGQNGNLYAGTGKAVSPAKDGGLIGTINLSTRVFTKLGVASTGSPVEALASFPGDNFPPTVTLNGANPFIIQKAKPFVDPLATSADCHDGPETITGNIANLNMGAVGVYTVPYTDSDTTQKSSTTIRTVDVIDFINHGPYAINVLPDDAFYSTFEIQDAMVPASTLTIQARIFTTSDTNGINVVFTRVGTTTSFLNSAVLLIDAASDDSQDKLKAANGDEIKIFYNTVTSDPFVAGTTPTGFGNSPLSSDKIKLDSTDFVLESRTNIFVTLDPLPATPPATVTATIQDDDGNSLTLTTLARVGTSKTWSTILPVVLSAASGSSTTGSATENPVLRGIQVGDPILATAPLVPSFTARANIIATPPSVAYDPPVVPIVYGTGVVCSSLGLSDPDNDGICSGDSALVPWETGTTPLKIYLTTAERTAGTIYTYRTNEAGAPASGCPRLLNVPNNPVVRADNPFTCPHPSKKDVYVEINCMVNHCPDVNALMDVIKAYTNRNVNLHILYDEQIWQCLEANNPPNCTRVPLHESSTSWARYLTLKGEFFGTENERAGGPSVILQKAQVFKSNFWIHATSEIPLSLGRAETGGNDFVNSFGNWFNNVGTQDIQAAGFMHELGHTLNLHHGGAATDPINCKPNYAGIMSYSQMIPTESGGLYLSKAAPALQWRLDYSGVQLSDIDENALSESVNAMTGTDAKRSPIYTVIGGPGITPTVVTTGGMYNWNGATGPASGTYAQNVRDVRISGCFPLDTDPDQFIPGNPPDTTLVLKGYNDWANIKPNARAFGAFSAGLSTVPHLDSQTFGPISAAPALTSAPFVAIPTSNFEIDEGDGSTVFELVRIIDYDSQGANAVNVDANFNDFDVQPIETFNDVTVGGTVPDVDLSGTHAYGDNGTPTIELTVTNNRGGQTVVDLVDDNQVPLVTVRNVAPIVEAPTVSPSNTVTPGQTVTVSAQFSDPGRLDTHAGSTIDWDDGTVSSVGAGLTLIEPSSPGSVSASHAYLSSGIFSVTITVIDDDGGSSSRTVQITVQALELGNFISPIDNRNYNWKSTTPIKMPVTLQGQPVSTASLYVFVCDLPNTPSTCTVATSKQQSGNLMVYNSIGQFYEYGLDFPANINKSVPHTIRVELAGGLPAYREVTITVS